MEQEMTIEEIEKNFDSEWVLVENPVTNDEIHVAGGKVLFHSKDRDEVYEHLRNMKSTRFAVLYAGKIPEGTAVIL